MEEVVSFFYHGSGPKTEVDNSGSSTDVFKHGLIPYRIIEASRVDQKLMFLVEWINGSRY